MATRTQRRSSAVDDYLKAILALSGPEDLLVTSNALAERLQVRAASVTGMIQKLAAKRPPLVVYRKHAGVRLSAAGKRRAWELVRHHRLIELFLHDVLKYSWDEVHDEAELLEHVISERFEERVAALLGDPRIDPHGHVIPARDGTADAVHEVPLEAWPPGKAAVVASVADRDAVALRELRKIGLRLGVTVRVARRHSGGSLTIRIGRGAKEIRIGAPLAAAIAVREPGARIRRETKS